MSKLQELRKSRKLSQKELADLLGVKLQKIQHYESGFRSIDGAKLDFLLNLASVLDCYLSELLEDPELAENMAAYEKIQVIDHLKRDVKKEREKKEKNK